MTEVLCALHGWEPEDTDCDVAATEMRVDGVAVDLAALREGATR